MHVTDLSELLNQAKGDRSVDTLIAEAERAGSTINATARATIYKALRGEHAKHPRERTLNLFSAVFDLDVRKVREAAGRPSGELGAWEPTPEAAQLNQDQRRALDMLIKSIVKSDDQAVPALKPLRPGVTSAVEARRAKRQRVAEGAEVPGIAAYGGDLDEDVDEETEPEEYP